MSGHHCHPILLLAEDEVPYVPSDAGVHSGSGFIWCGMDGGVGRAHKHTHTQQQGRNRMHIRVCVCLTKEHDGGVSQEAESNTKPPLHPSTVRLNSVISNLHTDDIHIQKQYYLSRALRTIS